MDFDKMLSHQVEMIEVPDELSPDNIAMMLKAHSSAKQAPKKITMKTAVNRNIVMRSVSVAAALAAMAAGLVAYMDKSAEPAQLESEIVYKDIEHPLSYNDLFDIYTQIYLSGGETASVSENDYTVTGSDSANTANSEYTPAEVGSAENTVRAANGTVFYLKDGNICSISSDGIKLCADVSGKSPIEMHIENNRLILVSEITHPAQNGDESPVRTDAEADIYDISGGTAEFVNSITQSGRYISSRVSDGKLYMVTCYSDYRAEPLGEETDLESYVPYYLLGSEKKYVAANDIIVPANAASTDYTVVSATDTDTPGDISVKALLGSSRKIYCSDTTLYTAGVGKGSGDTDYTALTSFDITDGIEYKASGSVEGVILGHGGFDEYSGNLRVVTDTCADDTHYTNIYVLDQSLSVVNSAGKLLPGSDMRSVSFVDRYAVLNEKETPDPALIIDLASDPPVVAYEMMNSGSSVFKKFNDGLMAGLGYESGRGLVLTMFCTPDSSKLADTVVADEDEVFSEAFSDRRALIVDGEKKLIGVPVSVRDEFGVHGRYCLFKYIGGGFAKIGQVEYSDVDESCVFRSAVISDDSLYIISDARIVMVRLSDMKVIDTFDIN